MERVFSIESGSSSFLNLNLDRARTASPDLRTGVVRQVLEPGHFIISLADGTKIEVRGLASLKVGREVQVFIPSGHSKRIQENTNVDVKSFSSDEGVQWSAFIPLGFGGGAASAKLEVFVEKKSKKFLEKNTSAAYFIFTVETEKQGLIQWSIYLWKKQVSIHVYAQSKGGQEINLRNLVQEIERSLKGRGFVIVAPTVLLKKPFKVPAGFRLNVRG